MNDKELIINTAKEIIMIALEYEDIISPDEELKLQMKLERFL